jgi:hypothetical protein
MSKIGNWVFEMQEDAQDMTRTDFVFKHGTSNIAVWDEVNGFGWDEFEPEYVEMDDGA